MVAAGVTLVGPVETQTIMEEFKTKQLLIGVVLVNGMMIVQQKNTLSSAELERPQYYLNQVNHYKILDPAFAFILSDLEDPNIWKIAFICS